MKKPLEDLPNQVRGENRIVTELNVRKLEH